MSCIYCQKTNTKLDKLSLCSDCTNVYNDIYTALKDDAKLQNFKITSLVQKNNFFTSFHIQNKLSHKEFILKVVTKTYTDNPEFMEQIKNEACIEMQAYHPSIVLFHGGFYAGEYYVLMYDYFEAKSLSKSSLPEDSYESLALDILKNLIICCNDIFLTTKIMPYPLIDRNIAIDTEGTIKITNFNMPHASLEYNTFDEQLYNIAFSNLQHIQKGEISIKTTIYSLGVIIYKLLNKGLFPFKGSSEEELLDAYIEGDIKGFILAINPNLEKIIKKMLSHKNYDSYGSFEEILEDIHQLQKVSFTAPVEKTPQNQIKRQEDTTQKRAPLQRKKLKSSNRKIRKL